MKKVLDIDTEEYFQWYSSWIDWKNVSAEEIKNGSAGVSPFGMFSDWLDTKAVHVKDIEGKYMYYPLNMEREDTITTDTYIEGVSIHYGYIEKVVEVSNGYVVYVNDKQFFVSKFDADQYFYESKDILLAQLHYDGEAIYDVLTLKSWFDSELYIDKTEE